MVPEASGEMIPDPSLTGSITACVSLTVCPQTTSARWRSSRSSSAASSLMLFGPHRFVGRKPNEQHSENCEGNDGWNPNRHEKQHEGGDRHGESENADGAVIAESKGVMAEQIECPAPVERDGGD